MTTLPKPRLGANFFMVALLMWTAHAVGQPSLPPQVQADMLKRSIVAAFAQADNAKVLAEMDKYHTLAKKGVPIPGPLLFIESKVASASGQNIRAEGALRKYFEVVDANDPRYQEALELYPRLQALKEKEFRINEANRLQALQSRLTPMLEEMKAQMLLIPSGSFRMGCSRGDSECWDRERPSRDINVGTFRIGKYEVTMEQYDLFAEATKRTKPADQGWGRGSRPVINVSWEDAQTYAQWISEQTELSFRLPNETEWEYAARAGSGTKFSWGSRFKRGEANCDEDCGDAFRNTAPVGSFSQNSFGLFDMHGNVREWVQDRYPDDSTPSLAQGRVTRGGSWRENPIFVRISYLGWANPTRPKDDLGFRVVQDI